MNEHILEAGALILGLLMYFAGLAIWPIQACVRRRWDVRSKALAIVCGLHLGVLLAFTAITDAKFGSDAHHAWWMFVLLNLCSSFASLFCWLAASEVDARKLRNRTG
jgi:drug/metabolite transporter (DMT)-like permease